MKRLILFLIVSNLFFVSCSIKKETKLIELKTKSFQISIDEKGYISKLIDVETGTNYLSNDTIAPIMSVSRNDEIVYPQSAELKENTLILKYGEGVEATIKFEQKESHISFELLSLSNSENINLIIWGPYPSTIKKVIGETVGVVQGEEFAIGIQALNPKTLGGYPWNENDCMPQIDIFEQDDYSDMKEEGKRHVLYRVEAAKPTGFGSTLQAYCRNRLNDRIIENWGHEKYLAPAFEDGGYIGSKIALFGCPVKNALETIGKIEIAEGLPHPMIDNKWGKIAPSASSAYLIMGFGENDVDRAIAVTKKAGLK